MDHGQEASSDPAFNPRSDTYLHEGSSLMVSAQSFSLSVQIGPPGLRASACWCPPPFSHWLTDARGWARGSPHLVVRDLPNQRPPQSFAGGGHQAYQVSLSRTLLWISLETGNFSSLPGISQHGQPWLVTPGPRGRNSLRAAGGVLLLSPGAVCPPF